jgi:thiol-disulfide isomerase/thioredoxin
MSKKNSIVYGAVAIAFAAIGLVVGCSKQEAPAAPAAASATAPVAATPEGALFAAVMPDNQGVKQALAQWKGKPLIVNFWAPWCGPCVQEMPELSQLATDSAGKNINVIGIGIDSPTNIAEFGSKFKISYPLYVAGMSGTELSRSFGNSGGSLPYTVLIGADGKVKKTYLGRIDFAKLKADLATL